VFLIYLSALDFLRSFCPAMKKLKKRTFAGFIQSFCATESLEYLEEDRFALKKVSITRNDGRLVVLKIRMTGKFTEVKSYQLSLPEATIV